MSTDDISSLIVTNVINVRVTDGADSHYYRY